MNDKPTSAFRVDSVAAIGAGPAGRAFAFACARAGMRVVLEDVMPEKLRRAQDEYSELEADAKGSLRYAMTVEDAVADADLAIDFVPDELESKLEIFSMLDRMAPPRTILLTPTDALSITDLASCTYRSARCVGVRDGMTKLLRSKFVEEDVLSCVVEFLNRLDISVDVVEDVIDPMLVKNSPGALESFDV